MEYKFVKVKDLVKAVEEGYEVGFTFDTTDEAIALGANDFEPSGWHGIKTVTEFDYEQYVIGYYGGGIERVCNFDEGNLVDFFIAYYDDQSTNDRATEDTLVCVESLECFENDEEFQLEISKAEFEALDQERRETLLMETCVYFTDMWNEFSDKFFYIDSLTKAQIITEWTREFELSNFSSPEYEWDFLVLADRWFKRKYEGSKDYLEVISVYEIK